MNYLNQEKFLELNREVSATFSNLLKVDLKVRVFQNSSLALYDTCLGLTQFLSHKPKVALDKQGTSLLESLLPNYYRQQTPLLIKKEQENITSFLAPLDHEVNYMIWSSENEITGEHIHTDETRFEIHKTLSAKRVFSIEIKSDLSENDAQLIKQFPYVIIIKKNSFLTNEPSFVIHSEKLKTPFLIGSLVDAEQLLKDYNKFSLVLNSMKQEPIDEFFNLHPLNYYNRFAGKVLHKFDRFVVYSKTVSASQLKTQLNLTNTEALALCELPLWILDSIQNWWEEARRPELIAGLLVIKKTVNTDQNFFDLLAQTHQNIATQNTWPI